VIAQYRSDPRFAKAGNSLPAVLPVAKGERSGDISHRVSTATGILIAFFS
jgi:hypothetical protein